jgi:DNA modification methylase
MEAQSFRDAGGMLTGTDHQYDDSQDSWRKLMSSVIPHLFRVAKPEAHAYIFCDIDRFHELREMMRKAGWYVFRTPLVNYKPHSGRIPLPEHGPRRQYELILYAIKGKKKVTGIYSDVIPSKLEENLGHGANKPIELYVDLLKRSVMPGDSVLDCFAGTGTIFPAAHQLRVKAVGIEQSAEYYGICLTRLNKLDEQPAML